jgi:hypothetical protein
MKINSLFLIILLLMVISLVLIYKMGDNNVDYGIVKWDRTRTIALCEGNRCVDYLVYCKNKEVLEKTIISDEVVFSNDWVDKREKKELC